MRPAVAMYRFGFHWQFWARSESAHLLLFIGFTGSKQPRCSIFNLVTMPSPTQKEIYFIHTMLRFASCIIQISRSLYRQRVGVFVNKSALNE